MIFKTTLALFSVFIISCGPMQNQPAGDENNLSEMEAKKMIAEGYLAGKIIYSNLKDDCEYTIQLESGERGIYYVDPVNLKEKFKQENQAVWVKYNGLRQMNRCNKAIPVEVTSIVNRTE